MITIIALVVRAYFILNGNAEIKPHQAQDSAFFNGIIEGYFLPWMVQVSLSFSVIVINAVKSKTSDSSVIKKQTILSAIIAAVALGLIHVALGWIGNNLHIESATHWRQSNKIVKI